MKRLNVIKLAVSILVVSQLLNTNAFASVNFKETILTTKRDGLSDPYFQLRPAKIQELSDEEAMEFIGDNLFGSSDNNGIINKGTSSPKIPPRPPEAKGGATDLVAAVGGGASNPVSSLVGGLDSIILVIDKLIAIGQKIMPTIEKGRAVVTNNPMATVSVLPRLESKDPVLHDMGGWSIPVTKHYKISFSNGFGSEAVSFVYSITFQHNGQYNGKGKYLTGIRASARNITVNWGFDLDASSQLLQISNIGTSENVVAGATLEISYTVKNWTRTLTTNESFFVSGDGRLFKLD
jgi:hypothetical protein